MSSYAFAFLTIALTAYGQLMIKARSMALAAQATPGNYLIAMFSDFWVWTSLIGAVGASAAWILAIRQTQLVLLYPLTALSFVLVPALSLALLGETLKPIQIAGILFVVTGVAMVSFGR